jgi:hypothetical protein
MKITVVWDMMPGNQLFCSLLIEVSFIHLQVTNLHTCMHCAHLRILMSNNVSNQNNKNSTKPKLNFVHFHQLILGIN